MPLRTLEKNYLKLAAVYTLPVKNGAYVGILTFYVFVYTSDVYDRDGWLYVHP